MRLRTRHVIYRSLLRPANTDDANLRASKLAGEPSIHNEVVKSRNPPPHIMDESKPDDTVLPSPVFNPEDLIGRSFLMDKQPDGQRPRATITQPLEDHESKLEDNPTRIKFKCTFNNDQQEDIITYNKMLEYITRDEDSDITWKFRRIVSHEGPSPGSQYDRLIVWENGEITKEPLKVIATDDPVTCAIYARENGLLNKPGWKRFRHIAKNGKKFTRMVNQAKLKSFNTAPRYKYGYEIPRTSEQAKKN
jgi:hypothetical protein